MIFCEFSWAFIINLFFYIMTIRDTYAIVL